MSENKNRVTALALKGIRDSKNIVFCTFKLNENNKNREFTSFELNRMNMTQNIVCSTSTEEEDGKRKQSIYNLN